MESLISLNPYNDFLYDYDIWFFPEFSDNRILIFLLRILDTFSYQDSALLSKNSRVIEQTVRYLCNYSLKKSFENENLKIVRKITENIHIYSEKSTNVFHMG